MRENKCEYGLALISGVLHVDIFCIGNIAHGFEIGLCDFAHTDIALARWRQLHVLLELVVVGKGERANHRVLGLKPITGSVQLIHDRFGA